MSLPRPRRGSRRGAPSRFRERPALRRSRFRSERNLSRRLLFVLGLLAVVILGTAVTCLSGEDSPSETKAPESGNPTAAGAPSSAPPRMVQSGAPLSPPSPDPLPGGTQSAGRILSGKEAGASPSRSGSRAALTHPSLWGYPFVGYGLNEISRELSARYSGQVPRSWGENLTGVAVRLESVPKASGPVAALTLDACDGSGESGYDAGLIAFLRERRIPATLFVTSLWARANPQTLKELSSDPLFEIAAHGARHKPCSVNGKEAYGIKGTASITELVGEVEGNARELQRATGRRPHWFRAGTAFYDDIAVKIIRELGLNIAGYSIAADEGASLPAAKVAAKTMRAGNGDIILAHMNHPGGGTREGLMEALTRLQGKGYVFIRLSDSLEIPEP